MDAAQVVMFAVSLALGLLSIGLGAFAVWLSLRFDDRSATALKSVQALALETRVLVQAVLDQARELSNKMLDSILEQGKFGGSPASLSTHGQEITDVLKEQLASTEKNITASVVETVRELGKSGRVEKPALEAAIHTIEKKIGSVSEAAAQVSSQLNLPDDLSGLLRRWVRYPAHYVLLAAIVRKGAHSLADLEGAKRQYNLPSNFSDGVDNLIRAGILIGTPDAFSVLERYRKPLIVWLRRNDRWLRLLMHHYGVRGDQERGISPTELALGEQFLF